MGMRLLVVLAPAALLAFVLLAAFRPRPESGRPRTSEAAAVAPPPLSARALAAMRRDAARDPSYLPALQKADDDFVDSLEGFTEAQKAALRRDLQAARRALGGAR